MPKTKTIISKLAKNTDYNHHIDGAAPLMTTSFEAILIILAPLYRSIMGGLLRHILKIVPVPGISEEQRE